jgi:hypothetical protein
VADERPDLISSRLRNIIGEEDRHSSAYQHSHTFPDLGGQYVNEMGEQDHGERKSYLGGRWRSEALVEDVQHELDARAVNVVPGSPVELDAAEVKD